MTGSVRYDADSVSTRDDDYFAALVNETPGEQRIRQSVVDTGFAIERVH